MARNPMRGVSIAADSQFDKLRLVLMRWSWIPGSIKGGSYEKVGKIISDYGLIVCSPPRSRPNLSPEP